MNFKLLLLAAVGGFSSVFGAGSVLGLIVWAMGSKPDPSTPLNVSSRASESRELPEEEATKKQGAPAEEMLEEEEHFDPASQEIIPREQIPIIQVPEDLPTEPVAESPVAESPVAESPVAESPVAESPGSSSAAHADLIGVAVELPFRVTDCSTDGVRFVAWGYEKKPAPGTNPRTPPPRNPTETYLAIVNLADLNVLHTKILSAHIERIEVTRNGIFASANYDTKVRKFDLVQLSDELEIVERNRVDSGNLSSVAGKYLRIESSSPGTCFYRIPSMELDSIDKEDALTREVLNGWIDRGVLWDKSLENIQLIIENEYFLELAANSRPKNYTDPILKGPLLFTSRKFEREEYLSPHFPMVVRPNKRLYRNVEFTHPSTGIRLATVKHEGSTGSSYKSFVTTPSAVIAVRSDGGVSVFPVPKLEVDLFQIERRHSTMFLSASKPTEVSYRAKDAFLYQLETNAAGVGAEPKILESETGDFTIDLRGTIANLKDALSKGRSEGGRELNDYHVERAKNEFKRLTGKSAKGIPMTVQVSVRAYRKDLAMDILTHYYLVDVPIRWKPKKPSNSTNKSTRNTAANSTAKPGYQKRTWADKRGNKLLATFVKIDGQAVLLRKPNGTSVRVPISQLSTADQQWLKSREK